MVAVAARNRRNFPRRRPRSTAKLECRRGSLGLGANVAVDLLDISESGMRLVVRSGLQPHDEVEIVLQDYGQRSAVKRLASVCWCLPLQDGRFCVGVSFEKWISFADIQQVSKP